MRIVQVFIDDHRVGTAVEVTRDGRRIRTVAERQQLHEQPPIGALRPAVLEPSFLADIRRFHAGASGRMRRRFGGIRGH